MTIEIHHKAEVPESLSFKRLDHVVAALFPQYSRSRLQQWIKQGDLRVDGEVIKAKQKLVGGEMIEIETISQEVDFVPQDIELDIVFEDEAVLVINKPRGLVVHPGAGNPDGTLLNALLHHSAQLEGVPRAGIVHRLDKDTTGLLVVAKTLESQNHLVQQLQARTVSRIYDAVVYGLLTRGGKVDAPIGRHPTNRVKMTIREGGKDAVTNYMLRSRFEEHCHVELSLETGRTHQIRVHMLSIGHPLIGDTTYGGGYKEPINKNPQFVQVLKRFSRPALHARQLRFVHPRSHENVNFQVDMPSDMQTLINTLKSNMVSKQ